MGEEILIVHPLFEELGGAEYLALNMVRALQEEGYSVTLATVTPVKWGKVSELFGLRYMPKTVIMRRKLHNILNTVVRGRFSRLRKLMIYKWLFMEMLNNLNDYDVIIETQSNLPSPADISYIHYPLTVYVVGGLYGRLIRWYMRRMPRFTPRMVLTNSTWTANIIRGTFGMDADVLYPPVSSKEIMEYADDRKREKIVITVSRLTPEKNLTHILNVAKELKDYTFFIIGSSTPNSYSVVRDLERRAEELGLSNVFVETDLPRKRLLDRMATATFYLHPPYPEHFGIAVVEAMAAGLIPLVYKDGGAWTDVVSRVSYTLGYRDIEMVPKVIKLIDSNEDFMDRLRERCMKVSLMFDYEGFKVKIAGHVKSIVSLP